MKKQTFFIIAAILITLFIWGNSMIPAHYSNMESNLVLSPVKKIANAHSGITELPKIIVVFTRKSAHILEFALQGFLLAGCFSGIFKKRIIYVLFFGLMTACIDEFIQLFPDGRAAMIQDVFFDFAGTVLGLLVFFFIYKLNQKRNI